MLGRHLDSSAQLPVRISVTLVVFLVYLATKLSLDVLLGAFAAGVIVRLFIRGENSGNTEQITSKLEAIGFGFLIPIFFIETGVNLDLHALEHKPKVLLLVPLFAVLFLFTRGLPTLRVLPPRPRQGAVSRRSASFRRRRCPLVVVITTIGVDEHKMKPQNASALVAAGHAVRPRLSHPGAPATPWEDRCGARPRSRERRPVRSSSGVMIQNDVQVSTPPTG